MKLVVKPQKITLNESADVDMVNTGLADIVISSINSKWESVRDLNSIIVNLKEQGYDDFVPIIESVLENENNSIGQLQHIVELLSPDAENIEQGKQEAEDLLQGDIYEGGEGL